MRDGSSSINLAGISLGSNIEPEQNLKAAVQELAKVGAVKCVSKVWESAPVGFLDQANFLNAAVLFATPLSAQDLKQSVLEPIEQKLHRQRDPGNINAPRTIDLDLSIWITPQESQVFDAEIQTRAFVAIPLAEILPDFLHPANGLALSEIAKRFADDSQDLVLREDCDLTAVVDARL